MHRCDCHAQEALAIQRTAGRMRVKTITGGVVAAILAVTACAGGRGSPHSSPSSSGDYTGIVRAGKGVACAFLGRIGPPSYSVRDIGKAGVPRVDARDLRVLHSMMRYVHPSTL